MTRLSSISLSPRLPITVVHAINAHATLISSLVYWFYAISSRHALRTHWFITLIIFFFFINAPSLRSFGYHAYHRSSHAVHYVTLHCHALFVTFAHHFITNTCQCRLCLVIGFSRLSRHHGHRHATGHRQFNTFTHIAHHCLLRHHVNIIINIIIATSSLISFTITTILIIILHHYYFCQFFNSSLLLLFNNTILLFPQ